ncbi:hypothetical protein [Bacillus pseudomycoides]|uniref:hypothetical protein n=1 Tax=Bacillus pseudomycoides TaxID=64104 RepID=UPI0020D287B8|nr:hypothetical protein [Bacillus pseudomycoides]
MIAATIILEFFYKDIATIERLVIIAMKKKSITLEQTINLVISSVEENKVATVATDSVAASEQKKSLWSRLFGK